jgi:hypothetical protein
VYAATIISSDIRTTETLQAHQVAVDRHRTGHRLSTVWRYERCVGSVGVLIAVGAKGLWDGKTSGGVQAGRV